jgi:hypothetical protein
MCLNYSKNLLLHVITTHTQEIDTNPRINEEGREKTYKITKKTVRTSMCDGQLNTSFEQIQNQYNYGLSLLTVTAITNKLELTHSNILLIKKVNKIALLPSDIMLQEISSKLFCTFPTR